MLETLSLGSFVILAIAMAGAGAFAGVLAGLFGIGGGAVLVPILVEFFGFLGVPEAVRMHLAIGTSLAIIVPTSIRSYLAHRAKGAPDAALLRSWIVVVPAGVILASFLVAVVSGDVLRLVFAVVAIFISVKMLFNRSSWRIADDLPPQPWRALSGGLIGFVSTFMGIGGGNLNNVFMTSFGRSIHQAVATSAGLGALIAIPGVITYVIIGWGNPDLLVLSLGYVNLIAVVAIMPMTLLCAPLGVRLAHSLTKRQMEIAFGLFMLVVAARFIVSVF